MPCMLVNSNKYILNITYANADSRSEWRRVAKLEGGEQGWTLFKTLNNI